jgi:hypothetical protein
MTTAMARRSAGVAEQPDQLQADCGTNALTVPEAQRLFHLLTTLPATCRRTPPAR